jgi:hypothetical protein
MPQLRLNRNRPFGSVYAMPGVAFQQDGHHFDFHGHLIGDSIEVHSEDDNVSTRPAKGTAEEVGWLKTQLEIYGHPFTTVAQARKFLAGMDID